MTQQNPETTEHQPVKHIMPLNPKFETRYDQNRDPFYGLERDPYTGRIDDCRDRD